MNRLIFDHEDYKTYLNQKLDELARKGDRGPRSRLSEAIGCQTAYTAQVLRGRAHFSAEQLEAINDFLGHSEEEGAFLLLLAQWNRAGTLRLRARYRKQIEATRNRRLDLKSRLGIQSHLTELDQVTYYSSWLYGAVHALLSIPKFHSVEVIANHLQIEPNKIANAIEFLIHSGLIVQNPTGPRYSIGKARIHLGADSPLIARHHINWRLQAMRALEKGERENLHYSSSVSISHEDFSKIREILVRAIESVKEVVRPSPEEKAACFAMDWFEI